MKIIAIYNKLTNWWFAYIPEKLRFLLVGGFNTVFSYLLFLISEFFWGYRIAVIFTYMVAINVSIFTMRLYVFNTSGNLKKQYAKAALVYIISIMSNYVFLFLTIDCLSMSAWLAQALFAVLSTVVIYFWHKNISFSKSCSQ